MEEFRVVEKFVSINGEAHKAGMLAAFIRFAGCNLNCSYCDTRWANESKVAYEIMSEADIYHYVKSTNVRCVTLTGGEPLIQPNIDKLIRLLGQDQELRVEIETNGAVDITPFIDIPGDIAFTLDYKSPGSGMCEHMLLDNYEHLRKKDSAKFVVTDKADLEKACEIIDFCRLNDKVQVYFSSAFAQISPAEIVDFMIKNNRTREKLQLQLHKYIWDPDRKGV